MTMITTTQLRDKEKVARDKPEVPFITTTSTKTKKKEVVIPEPTENWPDKDMLTTHNVEDYVKPREPVEVKKTKNSLTREQKDAINKRNRERRAAKRGKK